MLESLWNKLVRREPPLVRVPSSGRPRTYSAESGYVYQYSFIGFRRVDSRADARFEYVFELSTGRMPPVGLNVILKDVLLRESIAAERELTASERYGVAKLALKRALDAFDHPSALEPTLIPGVEELHAIGEVLDL